MRCRDKRWDKRVEQAPKNSTNSTNSTNSINSTNSMNKEFQEKLRAMEAERKQQDAMWTETDFGVGTRK